METNSNAFKILRILYLNRNKGKMNSNEISERTKIKLNHISAITRIMVSKGLLKKEKINNHCYYWISKNEESWAYKILERGMDKLT